MAGTYGAAGTNSYTITGVGGILSNEVDATTGVTQVYRGGALTTQQSIGTYNPATGSFTPDINANLTDAEKRALSSTSGTTTIKNAAIQTATKAGATNASQLLSPNTATGTAGGDQPGGGNAPAGITDSTKTGDIRQKYGDWRYPITMSGKQDRIKITMYRYATKPFNPGGVGTGDAFGTRTLGSPMGSVVLPIQPTISDSNRVEWGGQTMDAAQQGAAGGALAFIQGGVKGAEEFAKSVTPESAEGIKQALVAKIAEQAGGFSGGGLLTRLSGGILNSNLELLFSGPALRTFSFTFSMSARSDKEAKTIRNIIRFFKQGMSVKRATTNLFIMSPNIFTIKYYFGGESTEHPWINKIKECALTDCSVNYTPAGNYATYADGAMTQYDLTLNFSELDVLYDDMYGGDGKEDEKEIGY
jgi:hypothetical protein